MIVLSTETIKAVEKAAEDNRKAGQYVAPSPVPPIVVIEEPVEEPDGLE